MHFTLPAGQEIAALFCDHAGHSGGGDAPSPCAQAEDGQKEPRAHLEARDDYDDDATLSLDERSTILYEMGCKQIGGLWEVFCNPGGKWSLGWYSSCWVRMIPRYHDSVNPAQRVDWLAL